MESQRNASATVTITAVDARLFYANVALCTALALALNALLARLILQRRRRGGGGGSGDDDAQTTARNTARILLQGCVVDTAFVVTFALVCPVFVVDVDAVPPLVITYTRGALTQAPRVVCFGAILVCTFTYFFTIAALPAQFVHRWWALCWRQWERNAGGVYALALTTALAATLGLCALTALVHTAADSAVVYAPAHYPSGHPNYGNGFADRVVDNRYQQWASTYVSTLTLISYALIALCTWRIWRQLRRDLHLLSERRSRALNVQITAALLAQALIPLALQFAPSVATQLRTWLRFTGDASVVGGTEMLIIWVAVLNPLATLFIVSDYRRVLIRHCQRRTAAIGVSGSGSTAIVTISREQHHLHHSWRFRQNPNFN